MKKIFATVLLLLTMLVTGCGGDSAENANNGNFTVMLKSNIDSLDTARSTDTASLEVIADCIDGLMQLDANDKPIPALAESVEVSEDGKTYIFHLRDAKWSNGDEVTAEDFIFAWRRHCQVSDRYAYIFGNTVACIKNADEVIKGADPATLGITAQDSKTLVVELNAPVPFFQALMAFPAFYPINENFYNSLAAGSYGTSPETFLSNGAFVLKNYLPGTANIQLEKNNSYWNAENVSLEKFQYQVVSSSDNALISFKNGTLNFASLSGNQAEHVAKDPELSKNLKNYLTGYMEYISFNQDAKNHHAGALANVNMRRAISHAVNRESLVDNYVMNGAKPTYTATPQGFAPNALTGKYFSEDQTKFSEFVSFDVDKARGFLETAKSELGKDNFDFYLIYANDGGDTVIKVAQAIKAQVEENLPGVTISLQPMPKAEYLDNVTSNNYDIAVTDWGPDYSDPMTYFSLWTTEGCEIAEHWSNTEYDKIIADCTTGELAANYDARWNALYDAEKILLENAVIAPLYAEADSYLISPNVTGIEFHTSGVNRVYKNVKIQ